MDRRKFLGVNAMSAIGTALPAHIVNAEAVRADKIREPARDLDIVDSSDILILGGGPAGCAAAIAAGRLGAKVLMVERYGYLGGLSTGGLVLIVGEYDRRIKGLPAEFVEKLLESGESRYVAFANRRVDDEPIFCPETLKFICLDMTEKAGSRFLFHSWS